ncbi:MAG: hypothetical protein LKI22_03425 [Liquorilactobacillus nagelii]|uniref:hypothetical protein n=1 Tax=Liquorilactobacillus nagelii TaxID=82688 RepID=UPI00242FF2FA|nr:hypothetical protein [Liquorilactobacillus nagelii]MCI1632989.1 hypothetical protein [Liquorilactobacillus nagelii]
MGKLKYIKELLGFIAALVLSCIGWAFASKTLFYPLVAAVGVLLVEVIVWLISNVTYLLKDNSKLSSEVFRLSKDNHNKKGAIKNLKEAIKGQVSYRNKIKRERNQYKQKLESANFANNMLVNIINENLSNTQEDAKNVSRKIVKEEDKDVKKAIQNSKDN